MNNKIEQVLSGTDFNCIEVIPGRIFIGTSDGFFAIDGETKKIIIEKTNKLPWPEITVIKGIDSNIWLGSTHGAFKIHSDGKSDYYASERWLPSDNVVDIADGPENSVLILTDKGLSRICFKEMTLHEKAMFL